MSRAHLTEKTRRKSISISGLLYYKARDMANGRGVSLSSIVENFLRKELSLPENPIAFDTNRKKVHRPINRPTPQQRADRQVFRQALEAQKVARRSVPAPPTRYELDAIDNPCRRENCHIMHLHVAHED